MGRILRRREFLLSAAILLLAGCDGLSLGLEAPKVSLADIRLVGGGLLEQHFLLTLRVFNPNDREIPVDSLSFQVELNGMEFARGASHRPVVLQPLGDTLVEVEGISNLASVLDQLRGLKPGPDGSGGIPYRIHGSLRSGSRGVIPFDRKGEVALPEALGGRRQRDPKPKVEQF